MERGKNTGSKFWYNNSCSYLMFQIVRLGFCNILQAGKLPVLSLVIMKFAVGVCLVQLIQIIERCYLHPKIGGGKFFVDLKPAENVETSICSRIIRNTAYIAHQKETF